MDCCHFLAVMEHQKLKNVQSDHFLLELGHTLYGRASWFTMVYEEFTDNLHVVGLPCSREPPDYCICKSSVDNYPLLSTLGRRS